MSSVSTTIRLDREIRDQTRAILRELGLDFSTMVDMLCRQIVRTRAVPLNMRLEEFPNAITRAAMEESLQIGQDPKGRNYPDGKSVLEEILRP